MERFTYLPKLRHMADLRSLLFIGVQLALLSCHYLAVIDTYWLLLATAPLAFISCIIVHNHMHQGTFTSRNHNNAFSLFAMLSAGQPPTGIITAHNENHHQHLNEECDFVQTSLSKSSHNFYNILIFPFQSVAKMYREKTSDLAKWKSKRPRLYKQALIERCILYILLITLLIFDWQRTLTCLVAPWLIGQYLLLGINLLQHQDCEHDSEWDHSRNLTGKFMNWLLLNNGFHTIHHISPSLHWSKLPQHHRDQVEPHMNPSLNHRSLTNLLWERLLRKP